MRPLTLAMIARIPASGVQRFQAYEDEVLPLLSAHGGTLQRRLRNADGTAELHILRFASQQALDTFRGDPRRLAAAPLLAQSGATIEPLEMNDVIDV